MRILFIAMTDSIHTARWINQLSGQGWDIHLFPVHNVTPHPELRDVTVYGKSSDRRESTHPSVRVRGLWPLKRGLYRAESAVRYLAPRWADRAAWLAWLICRLKPDIIHSMEIQLAGYLTYAARARVEGHFPIWVVSAWGSDIFLFGRLPSHMDRIRAILESCDYFCCDCQRDIPLARSLGFNGVMLPVLPVAGGFDVEHLRRLRQPGPTSTRRVIVLKGYQNWAGRSLAGLRAMELCADVLEDYRVAIYLASPEVELAAELFSSSTGIATEILPPSTHDEVLRMHGRARVSVGLSISDGLPLSSLEAIAMGAFPIQSNTSCLDEWLKDGESALFVSPEDPENIAKAIRWATSDDELVDRAAEINMRAVSEKFDRGSIRAKVLAAYREIAAGIGIGP